jgi:hypothetical protein
VTVEPLIADSQATLATATLGPYTMSSSELGSRTISRRLRSAHNLCYSTLVSRQQDGLMRVQHMHFIICTVAK